MGNIELKSKFYRTPVFEIIAVMGPIIIFQILYFNRFKFFPEQFQDSALALILFSVFLIGVIIINFKFMQINKRPQSIEILDDAIIIGKKQIEFSDIEEIEDITDTLSKRNRLKHFQVHYFDWEQGTISSVIFDALYFSFPVLNSHLNSIEELLKANKKKCRKCNSEFEFKIENNISKYFCKNCGIEFSRKEKTSNSPFSSFFTS